MRRNIIILAAFVAFLVVVSVLAYNKLIPTEIKEVPRYDSIGHFVLFGMLGLIAHIAFGRRRVPAFGRVVPLGPTLAIVYACVDETLQVFSSNRTFDLSDLFFGVLGILVFTTIASLYRNRKAIDLRYYFAELFVFGLKELRATLFPILFIGALLVSNFYTFGLYRYDFLFIAAVVIQAGMLYFKLETKDEAKTIFLFHIIGLCLELFKTSAAVGSWSYPEASYLKIATVPLYSGFMYAAVGSYIAQAWKIFSLELKGHPPYSASVFLCAAIYLNFFTNHYFYDFRYFLFVAIFALYYKTNVYFTVRVKQYRMPLVLSFLLIGFFVWLAENIATYLGAWAYPSQIHEWHVVGLQKITSWFLLVIICFIVVAYLKHFKEQRAKRKE